jgi:hypothetical membrane protein
MNLLRTLTAAALLTGSAVYLAAEAIAASAWKQPTYSYADNWISDLGSATAGVFRGRELNSPLHAVMNSGFLIQGLLFGLGALLLSRTLSGRIRTFTAVMAVVTIVVRSLGLVAVITLFLTFGAGLPSGAVERASVYTIVIWQVAVAVALLGSVGRRSVLPT